MKPELWMTNRDKKRQPKQGTYWCGFCDAYLVHPGERCPNCHKRDEERKTNKK